MKNLQYTIVLLAVFSVLSVTNMAHAATTYGGDTTPQPYKSDSATAGGGGGSWGGSTGYVLPIQVFQVRSTTTGTSSSIAASSSIQTPDTHFFYKSLQIGSTGTEVVQLQRKLTLQNYFKGPVTGFFGNLTQAAVRQYQKDHNIPQFGIVGPLTRAALNSGQ